MTFVGRFFPFLLEEGYEFCVCVCGSRGGGDGGSDGPGRGPKRDVCKVIVAYVFAVDRTDGDELLV